MGTEVHPDLNLSQTTQEAVSHQRYILKLLNVDREKITKNWKIRDGNQGYLNPEMWYYWRQIHSNRTYGIVVKRLSKETGT